MCSVQISQRYRYGHLLILNNGSLGASKSNSPYLHVLYNGFTFLLYLLKLDVSVFQYPTTAQTAMSASKTEYTRSGGVSNFVIFSSVLPIWLAVDFRFCFFHVIWGNQFETVALCNQPKALFKLWRMQILHCHSFLMFFFQSHYRTRESIRMRRCFWFHQTPKPEQGDMLKGMRQHT